jgi:outer membrane protein assembly factor BamB
MITTAPGTSRRPLRLWPGVAIVVVLWLTRLTLPLWGLGAGAELMVRILGGFVGALAVLIWWLFFSRASQRERLGVLTVLIVAIAATAALGDPSMIVWLLWYGAPVLSLALVAGAVVSGMRGDRYRTQTIAAAITLTCAATMPFRIEGVAGHGVAAFAWRWTETAEQRLLARANEPPDAALRERLATPPPAPAPDTLADAPAANAVEIAPAPSDAEAPIAPAAAVVRWAGFRGDGRNGVVRGVRIDTNWSATPPVLKWRRPIGPGWASFAVKGDILYTQEQRGGDEIVSAYRVSTGEPVWRHRDRGRLTDPMGGPGPRATPTLGADRLYTFGSTGILNALDAATGAVAWSRNAATDLGAAIPTWGFSSSPLIVDDLVVVAVGGTLAAYALGNGEPRWTGPVGGDSYSSPQLETLDGVPQIILASAAGTTGVAPATGKALWTHAWDSRLPIMPIVQPAWLGDGTVLIGESSLGVRRLAPARRGTEWTVDERWLSNRLKPYFNDFVVHRGHAYGFDGAIMAAIDVADGARKWKGGRYGQGQLVLLPDQDLLLVLSEDGELALVKAAPEGFTEVARVPALTGKTWNHPVLVGDVLLVRNGEEMAAFQLPRARD